jgi:hypothetical protein
LRVALCIHAVASRPRRKSRRAGILPVRQAEAAGRIAEAGRAKNPGNLGQIAGRCRL